MTIAPYKSAYDRAKELEQEKKDRENGKSQWVNNFVELKDGERIFFRFLCNVRTEDHKHEMIAVMMHDYFVQSDNKYVRATCARDPFVNKPSCHWCQIAAMEMKEAERFPARNVGEKAARKAALSAAYKKKASYCFIIPVGVVVMDEETQKTKLDEKQKPITETKLLALKPKVLKDVMSLYEEGIEVDEEVVHDITIGAFVLKRTGASTDTTYSLMLKRAKRVQITPPPLEKVLEMILENRPYREAEEGVDYTASTTNKTAEENGSNLDEYPF